MGDNVTVKKLIFLGLFVLILGVVMVSADDLNVTTCVAKYHCALGTCQTNNQLLCSVVADTICNATYPYAPNTFQQACVYPIPQTNPSIEVTTIANGGGVVDVQNITDMVIKSVYYDTEVSFVGESINATAINATTIVVSGREVTINSTAIPELNKSAKITMGRIANGWHIYKDGKDCNAPQCTNVVYNKDTETLSFDVQGFSTYYVGTYKKEDLPNIVVDGIGTFMAAIVSYLDLIVITVVLLVGGYIIIKYSEGK
jgi:hypothetical protein